MPTTCIALLRGINIVGNNRLSMRDLAAIVERAGGTEVRTYIQSGNVVFQTTSTQTAPIAQRLGALILKRAGFEPKVLVLTRRDLERAAAGNPFPEADGNPTSLHVFFLAERPRKPNLDAIEALRTRTERYKLTGSAFYLHTPDGFGISKLATRAEALLGVAATARNWRTVTTLLEMTTALRSSKGPTTRGKGPTTRAKGPTTRAKGPTTRAKGPTVSR